MSSVVPAELVLRSGARLRIGAASHELERKVAALLCVLAVDGDAARSTMARWFWPEVEASAARRNLRQRIFQLHRRCGREVVNGGPRLRLAAGIACDVVLRGDEGGTAGTGAGALLAGFAYDELAEFSAWLAEAGKRPAEPEVPALTLHADVRAALADMAERLESILLADLAAEAAQATSTKWVSKRPARRSEK